MPAVTFGADRYSFCKGQQGDTMHWQHVVAQLRVTILAGSKLQRIEVIGGDFKIVNMDCKLTNPTVKCGRGYILAIEGGKSRFQLRLDPKSYAKAMGFFEKQKINTELVYILPSRPNSTASSAGLIFSDTGSSNGGCNSSGTGYARVPSSKLLMGSPEVPDIRSSPCLFVEQLPWVDENIIADTNLNRPVGRYGRCVKGTKFWKFILRNSSIVCSIKKHEKGLHLWVFLRERKLHAVELKQTPIRCGKSTIRFTDGKHDIQLDMGKEFLFGLVLEMRTLGIHHTVVEQN